MTTQILSHSLTGHYASPHPHARAPLQSLASGRASPKSAWLYAEGSEKKP